MLDRLTVIIPSAKDANENEGFLKHVEETCGASCDIILMVNSGGAPLTHVYQSVLDNNEIPNEVIVFMHDDIEFLRNGWGAEILRLFNEHEDYGIIGVAGSAEFHEEAAWWRFKKIYGQVLHRNEGKSWLTAFSPLLDHDLQQVCVIDGIFMAVHRNRISKGFDKDFLGFNHYDTSFCLENYLDGKTKIGVTTNIRLAHMSIGAIKPNWEENRLLLLNKLGNHFPIDVERDLRDAAKKHK